MIKSRFYLIKGDDKPIYVGFTNRPIKQRFSEHKADKDFSAYKNVTIEKLDELDYDFTWDEEILYKNADEVSLREAQLILEYGTQGNAYQKAIGGGQVWTWEKWFVRTNKDNPKFRGMSGDEIELWLDEEKEVDRYISNFVVNMNDPVDIYLKNFVSTMMDPVDIYLQNFVNHMNDPVDIYLQSFVSHMMDPVDRYLSDFVGSMNDPVDAYLKNFVSNMNDPVDRYLSDFVGSMNDPVDAYLKNFVGSMNDPVDAYLKNFVSHMMDPVDRYLSTFVSNMKNN